MSVTASMDSHELQIRTRLDALHAALHPAMRGSQQDMFTFMQSYRDFLDDVRNSHSSLSTETHELVHSLANTVGSVAKAVDEVAITSAEASKKIDEAIANLSNGQLSSLSLEDREPLSEQAPYVERCWTWLLCNLHDPYPQKVDKEALARQSGAPEKDIDAWFVDARRRIGWNDIRRAHSTTRRNLVRIATRFWHGAPLRTRPTEDQIQSDVRELDEYSYDFNQMAHRARNLYCHKFVPTQIASSLDQCVAESSAQQQQIRLSSERLASPDEELIRTASSHPQSRKRRNSEVNTDATTSRVNQGHSIRPAKRHRSSSPLERDLLQHVSSSPLLVRLSQSLSRDQSLSRSSSVESCSQQDDDSGSVSKRKRRMSDAGNESDTSQLSRAPRRRRVEDQNPTTRMSNPSSNGKQPSSSGVITSAPTLHIASESLTPAPAPDADTPRPPKRKRRLSEADGHRPRRRPQQAALSVPRLQTVSNPFPLSGPSSNPPTNPSNVDLIDPRPADTNSIFEGLGDFDIESFGYTTMPTLNDYLSQPVDPVASGSGQHNTSSSVATTSQTQAISDFQDNFLNLDAFLKDFPPFSGAQRAATISNQLDDFFSWPDLTASSGEQAPAEVPLTQPPSLNPTSGNIDMFAAPPNTINPVHLSIFPPPLHTTNLRAVTTPFPDLPFAPTASFSDADVASIALQRVQALQAQIDFYKAQLAQAGIPPF